MKIRFVLALALGVALGWGPPAIAGPATIDIGIVPGQGSISFPVLGGSLDGSGISVSTVEGIDTLLNNGVTSTIDSGLLNFTTGPIISQTPSNWIFGGGGSITFTGGVPDAGIADGSTLLSGVITNAQVVAAGSGFMVAVTGFVAMNNPDLLAHYGLAGTFSGALDILFSALLAPDGTFVSLRTLSGDGAETDAPPPPPTVPEPASLAILGLGLTGLGAIRRRRKA